MAIRGILSGKGLGEPCFTSVTLRPWLSTGGKESAMNTTTWVAELGTKPAAAPQAIPVVLPPAGPSAAAQPLHRLGEIRRREGLTRREVARRLGVSIREVQEREQSSCDISLSELHRWQRILQVPLAELLEEPGGELSPPLNLRARLLRAMKTVRSIQEVARQAAIQRLATVLADQILQIMPELKNIIAWPAVGHRRKQSEFGQAFFRGLSLNLRDEEEAEGPER
jgi:transcriptional regulator with XRE-family HTH domain